MMPSFIWMAARSPVKTPPTWTASAFAVSVSVSPPVMVVNVVDMLVTDVDVVVVDG